MMTTMWLTGVLAALSAMVMAQTVLLWKAQRALARLHAIEARVDKFGDAIVLLTDTTESAFRAVATEMTRPPAAATRTATVCAVSNARTRRVARAAARGTSVEQIAAAEEVAESEVRLRLHMAKGIGAAKTWSKTGARKPRTTAGANRGTVRLD
jgi:hypothetical protein